MILYHWIRICCMTSLNVNIDVSERHFIDAIIGKRYFCHITFKTQHIFKNKVCIPRFYMASWHVGAIKKCVKHQINKLMAICHQGITKMQVLTHCDIVFTFQINALHKCFLYIFLITLSVYRWEICCVSGMLNLLICTDSQLIHSLWHTNYVCQLRMLKTVIRLVPSVSKFDTTYMEEKKQ